MNVQIRIEGNEAALRLIQSIRSLPRQDALWQAIGESQETLIKRHLEERDAKPNKMGAKKTHFYRRAADSVSAGRTASSGVEVTVSQQGLRQRWKGGTITPKNSRLLTIPLKPQSRAKRAAEFGDLFLLRRPRGKRYGFLARSEDGGKRIDVLYSLMTSVTQSEDPDVFPTVDVMRNEALDTALIVLNRIITT